MMILRLIRPDVIQMTDPPLILSRMYSHPLPLS